MNCDIVCGNIIEDDNMFVFVQELDKINNTWNLPAGTLEPNESLSECAAREAKEETGLEVTVQYLSGIYQKNMSGKTIIAFIFYSEITGDGQLEPNTDHVREAEWVHKNDITDLTLRSKYISTAIAQYSDGARCDRNIINVLGEK